MLCGEVRVAEGMIGMVRGIHSERSLIVNVVGDLWNSYACM